MGQIKASFLDSKALLAGSLIHTGDLSKHSAWNWQVFIATNIQLG
jgi:hypothetical protein